MNDNTSLQIQMFIKYPNSEKVVSYCKNPQRCLNGELLLRVRKKAKQNLHQKLVS